MPEELDNNQEQNKDQNQQTETQKNEQQNEQKEQMIPKTRFDEINNKYKDIQTQLDELINEKKKAEQTSKEKQGEFEDLYKSTSTELVQIQTNYTASKDRVTALEGVIQGLLEAKLGNVDEQYHDLIPSNLAPEQKLDWLNKAEQKGLFKTVKSPIGGTNLNPDKPKDKLDMKKLSPTEIFRRAYSSK